MRGYYPGRLEAERLQRVYEIAPPRVQQYLEAEIRHVLGLIQPHRVVLELGCGYGRVALPLIGSGRRIVGIDTSAASLALGRRLGTTDPRPLFVLADAAHLAFPNECFDAVVCVQNGICAFGLDPKAAVSEAVRVARPGGLVVFSSYADAFWPARFEWFRQQALHGLVGEIDYDRSGDGVIACRDGFRAGTMRPDGFRRLCDELGLNAQITEVDGSSVFCEIRI